MADAELGIKVTTQGVTQAAADLDKLDASTKKVAQSAKDLGGAQQQSVGGIKSAISAQTALAQKTTATSKAFDFFRGVFGGASQELSRARAVHDLYAAAAGKTTEAITKTAGATNIFRTAIHALDPVLASAGVGVSGLGVFARAAHGNISLLAGVVGVSLLVAAEATADKIRALTNDIKNFAGSGEAADRVMKQLGDTARKTGADQSVLQQSTLSIGRALRNNATSNFIVPPGQANPFGSA